MWRLAPKGRADPLAFQIRLPIISVWLAVFIFEALPPPPGPIERAKQELFKFVRAALSAFVPDLGLDAVQFAFIIAFLHGYSVTLPEQMHNVAFIHSVGNTPGSAGGPKYYSVVKRSLFYSVI